MYEINYLIKFVTITEILTHIEMKIQDTSTATHSNQVTGQDSQRY